MVVIKMTMKSLPERIILFSQLHGNISLDENTEPITTTIPTGMEIHYIHGAAEGVCYYGYGNKDKETIKEINHIFNTNPNSFNDNLYDITTRIVNTFKKQSNILNEVEFYNINKDDSPKTRKRKRKEVLDPNELSYRYTIDQMFKTKVYHSGESIINKQFEKQTKYDKLYMISPIKDSNPIRTDIADLLKTIPMEYKNKIINKKMKIETISLNKLLSYLNNYGVKEVVFMDLSCSFFFDTQSQTYIEKDALAQKKRLTRRIRRSLKGGHIQRRHTKRRTTKKSLPIV